MHELRTVIESSHFHAGLLAGAVAAAVVVLLVVATSRTADERRGRRRAAPLAGLAFAVASLVGLPSAVGHGPGAPLTGRVVAGVVLVALAGLVVERVSVPLFAGFVVAIPGAALVAYGGHLQYPSWVRIFVLVAVTLGAPLAADFDTRDHRIDAGPVLLLVAVGGAYSTVPDTEGVLVLLGVALVVAFLAWPWPVARLGGAGAAAAIGVVVWTIAYEGRGRAGSIVGATGALGLLVLEPLGVRLLGALRTRARPVRRRPGRLQVLVPMVVAQVVLALYSGRVSGLEHDPARAAWLLVPEVVIGVVFAAATARPRRAPARSS